MGTTENHTFGFLSFFSEEQHMVEKASYFFPLVFYYFLVLQAEYSSQEFHRF